MENLIVEYKGFKIINSTYKAGWFMTECETMCGETVDEVKGDLDDLLIERSKGELITAYFQGGMGMGIIRVEGRLKDIGTRKYAQYNGAAYLHMIPKRKRKVRGYLQTYNPYMLVLAGVGHPNPEDGFNIIKDDGDVVVKQSKYMSFDPRWKEESDVQLDGYLENSEAIVLADYRHTKGFSAYTGRTTKIEA